MAHTIIHRAQQARAKAFAEKARKATGGEPPVAQKAPPPKPAPSTPERLLSTDEIDRMIEQRQKEMDRRERERRGGSSHNTGHGSDHKSSHKKKPRKKRRKAGFNSRTRF